MNGYAGTSKPMQVASTQCVPMSSPTCEAPISNACTRLECAVERLQKAVADLESRLQPVLTPPIPKSDKASGINPAAPDTPLSETMKQRAYAIDGATENLNDMLRRLGL